MYFIIIHSINIEELLSAHIILYKGKKKVCCIAICYREIKLKNDKRPVKKFNTDVQVKLCFLIV